MLSTVRVAQPHHIETYSKCPRKAFYSWDVALSISHDAEIIRNVICKTFTYESKYGIAPTFKTFSYWYEIEHQNILKRNLDYSFSKEVLSRLSYWYNNYYIKTKVRAISNLPISLFIEDQSFYNILDVVEVGDNVRVHDFRELVTEKEAKLETVISNDIKVYAQLLGLKLASGITVNEYVRWVIMPKSIRYLAVKLDSNQFLKGERAVRHILRGIKGNIWYPSVSEQCNKCPYNRRCEF